MKATQLLAGQMRLDALNGGFPEAFVLDKKNFSSAVLRTAEYYIQLSVQGISCFHVFLS